MFPHFWLFLYSVCVYLFMWVWAYSYDSVCIHAHSEPVDIHGLCVCEVQVGEGVVINNDISWARSNQYSLLLICYIYLSSPSFYHSYYHFISVFIYLLYSLFSLAPLLLFHLFSGKIWLQRDNRSTEATDVATYNSLYRNIAILFYSSERGRWMRLTV